METLAELQKFAKEAQEKISVLEAKIAILENNKKNDDAELFANSEEYEKLKAENAELKTIIEKKDYRIKHLIRSLEEEEQKEAEIAKLKYRINILLRSLEEAEGNAPSSAPSVSVKPAILIAENDPIANVDLRVGQIVNAWKHPDADKLICEEIDLGEGQPRKIASGLMQFYKPEEIIGKRVVIVANLKEKALKGYPSHGMVLCACNEDHTAVEIVEPPQSAPLGARILPKLNFKPKECTEINLNKKKNAWELASSELIVNAEGKATYKTLPLQVNNEFCTIPSLRNCHLS